MAPIDSLKLYWDGGPFRISLQHPSHLPNNLAKMAIEILEEFRSDCQSQYCAFSGSVNGRALAYEKFKRSIVSKKGTLFVGNAPPDAKQRPGKSTIVQISQGDFLDGLSSGGKFEDLNSKAFIVMVYHRWEEHFRHLISRTLSVPKKSVQCDLMGDVRQVRNVIIHHSSAMSQTTKKKLTLLPQIWDLPIGPLHISEKMLHSLMEQINAIHVKVV